MKILITGGTGFLGSFLVNRLTRMEADLVLLKRSTSDLWRIKESVDAIAMYDSDRISPADVIRREKPDTIFHLASDQGRQGESLERMIHANVTFPSTLLETAIQNGLRAFINTDTAAFSGHSLYAASKKAFLPVLDHFQARSAINTITLRLEYVYGPKDNDTRFLPYLIKAILLEKPIDASAGTQKRDFIYVQDVVKAYIKALDLTKTIENQNISFAIGSGQSISLRELAETISRLSGKTPNITWGTREFRQGDILESATDITSAKKILRWSPDHTLERGLEKTINWFDKQEGLNGKLFQ